MKKTIITTPVITLKIKSQHRKKELSVNTSTMTFSPSQLLKVVTVHSGRTASLKGDSRDVIEDGDDEGFNSK